MTKLVIAITLIALPDSLNPSLILTELFLAGGSHPRRRTAVFTVTATAVTFVGGVAIALGLGDLVLSLVPRPSRTVRHAITAVAGVLLIAGSVVLWMNRARAASRIDTSQASQGPVVVLAAGIAGVELLTAFPYFAAIALIVSADVSDGQKLTLLALYSVVYALPLVAIAIVCAVAGPSAQRLLGPLAGWLTRRWPTLVALLAGAVGAGLLVYGITPLVTSAGLM